MRGKPSKLATFFLSATLVLGGGACDKESNDPPKNKIPYFSHLYHGKDGREQNQICVCDDRPDKVKLIMYRYGRSVEVEVRSIGPYHVYFQPPPIWLVHDGKIAFKIIDEKDDYNTTFNLNVKNRLLEEQ